MNWKGELLFLNTVAQVLHVLEELPLANYFVNAKAAKIVRVRYHVSFFLNFNPSS